VVYRYLLFYKPYNVLSQFTEGKLAANDRLPANDRLSEVERAGVERGTLKNYISVPNVYAVGRLDRDSEGLLLLTDDGPMQHRLSHPKFAHERQYWVQVEGLPSEDAIAQLRTGVTIKGYCTRPAQVRAIAEPTLPPRDPPIRDRKHIPTAWLEMTLSEGKNRQVRRMTAAVGFPTLRLVRSALFLSVDSVLTLAGLQPGQWRELTAQERRALPRC
jgi:23S rRNA pseudouridine2457 synthase